MAFKQPLAPDERLRSRVKLAVNLTGTLGADDVDVVDFEGIVAEVGCPVLKTGRVLVGESGRVSALLERFKAVAAAHTHKERMSQSASLLDRMRQFV